MIEKRLVWTAGISVVVFIIAGALRSGVRYSSTPTLDRLSGKRKTRETPVQNKAIDYALLLSSITAALSMLGLSYFEITK